MLGANDPVDFANKIVQLIDDPELRERMGEYGRARVANELAWQYEVPKLLHAYNLLAGREPVYAKPESAAKIAEDDWVERQG